MPLSLPSFDIVTFDCYGTLVDWRGGIRRAMTDAASRRGIELSAERVLELHVEIEPTFQVGEYRSYREVLRLTAIEIARRLGWNLAADEAGFLADSLPQWSIFPDTLPALEAMRTAGIRLGILSNIDDDLLDGTLQQFNIPIDLRVTAEDVRGYKPGLAHFNRATELIGNARWLHAAQSLRHDIVPALQQGLFPAWINRLHEPLPKALHPDWEFPDLQSLAAALVDS